MSIYVDNKKAVICKGDYAPAALYKGEIKIAGYTEHEYQGTEIEAENTYRAELGLHLYGRSWQETTTGANLVNSTYYIGPQNNAKIAIVNPDTDFAGREWQVNADVENGNNNTGIAFRPNFRTENIKFKVGETYTMSGYVKGSFNSQNLFRINVFITRIDGSLWKPTRLSEVEIPSQIKEYTRYSITFTLPEDFDESENNVIIAFSNLGGNYYFTKPMLQKGSILIAYEPYTGGMPSPNPDYPQPINSIGDSGSVDVVVTGKNLIPTNLAQDGISYNADTKRWKFEALSKYGLINVRIIDPNRGSCILPAGQYTFTAIDSQNMLYTTISSIGNKNDWKILLNLKETKTSGTFTLTEDTRIGLFVAPIDTTQTGYIQIQLERGETATSYQPYREPQTLTINTPNGLCGIPVDTGGNYTDSTGQQWICDEIDFERGVYVQRVKKADVPNNVAWTIQLQSGNYALGYKGIFSDGQTTQTYSNYHPQWMSNLGRSKVTWDNRFSYGRSLVFWIVPYSNDGALTSDDINNWLIEHPMTVVYPLVTPIETPLIAEELAAYKAVKSYPHYTHIESAAESKVKLMEY